MNFPGSGPVSGTELTRRMQEQAEYFGCEFLRANVERIDASGAVRQVVTDRGTFECLGIVLATGAHPRPAGFEGEQSFRGHGVAYCATCDGAFFAGKEIFVIGGGFAAAEEAVFLTKFASHVTILIRGEDFTCARATADQARSNPKITVLTKVEVTEVAGDNLPRSITWKNLETGEVTSWAPEMGGTFGVFVFAGYQPSTDLVAGIADRNPQGYVLTDRNQQTSWPGIYAAGDVCDKPLRQAVTAAGDGATAATELERYLAKMQKETGRRGEAPMIHRDTPQKEAAAVSEEGGLFSEEMKGQLRSIFDKMETPLVLELFLDESDLSAELRQYMDFLAGLTDKLSVTVSDASGEDLPLVRVLRADGTWTGLSFHGVPGGHEFTSFVLGLYNASGPGQQLAGLPLLHHVPGAGDLRPADRSALPEGPGGGLRPHPVPRPQGALERHERPLPGDQRRGTGSLWKKERGATGCRDLNTYYHNIFSHPDLYLFRSCATVEPLSVFLTAFLSEV